MELHRPQHIRSKRSKLSAVFSTALIILNACLQPYVANAHNTIARPTQPPAVNHTSPQYTVDAQPVAAVAADIFDLNSPAIQGAVTLDASTPDSVRAGELITYAFSYQNTGAGTATGIVVDVIWSDFSVFTGSARQWCEPIVCPAQSIVGPAITVQSAPIGVSARYQIGDLGPGASGSFVVGLRTRSDIYPKTGQAIVRPAVSGKLYVSNNTSSIVSDDTSNTIVVGPVLTISKSVTNMVDSAIYPLQTADFVIRVGNATSPYDSNSGQIRADARPANNVIIHDVFPLGSDFVSATGDFQVDSDARLITWTLPSLAVGQSQDLRVTFRKLDINQDCTKLNNKDYNATSDEFPLNDNGRATIVGAASSVPVTIPLIIKSVVANPPSIAFGAETGLTIIVQSYWDQPISNLQLNYPIQQNTFYVANSAAPAATSVPTDSTPGGLVSWVFNMPAGTKINPSEVRFSIRLRAAYGGTTGTGTGVAALIVPVQVPSACVASKVGKVNVSARLSIRKSPDTTNGTQSTGDIIVDRNSEMGYVIDVTNGGTEPATGLSIVDHLPDDLNANFRYVANSATLNGSPRGPDTVQDGFAGTMTWSGLTVQPGETIKIKYRLLIDGTNFVRYCNSVEGILGSETMRYPDRTVCVRINPKIFVTKVANTPNTGKNQEVTFTLTLRNDEPTDSFQLGLQDVLGSFKYVRQVSGYSAPTVSGSIINWDVIDVGPGEEIQATIVAKTPDVCQTKDYYNEARFLTRDVFDNMIYTVQPLPSVKAKVKVICGTNVLEYSQIANRTPVSLGDLVAFTLFVTNTNTANTVTAVTVTNILPEAFTFVGMDTNSIIKTLPTIEELPDGRTKLVWYVPSIAKTGKITIKFQTRSGNLVAQAKNYMTVDANDLLDAICKGVCVSAEDNAELKLFAVAGVAVQPLITMEPYIADSNCALPGDTRLYRLTILNTNVHSYTQTGITITLPPGLYFSRAVDGTPTPSVGRNNEGETSVIWYGQQISEKPSTSFGSQMAFTVELKVGQILGGLNTVVQTASPDGLIPRKDGVADPTILVCAGSDPAIAIDANKHVVNNGEELVYIISIANPTNEAITATVQNVLPTGITLVSVVGEFTPNVSNNQLTWENVVIPAAQGSRPSVVLLRFRTTASGPNGTRITNSVQVLNSTTPITNLTYNSIMILIQALLPTFLPVMRK